MTDVIVVAFAVHLVFAVEVKGKISYEKIRIFVNIGSLYLRKYWKNVLVQLIQLDLNAVGGHIA